MMSIFALCACNASVRSNGPATWLTYAEYARSLGSLTAWTSVTCPFEITTRTTTSPKKFGASDPVKVPFTVADVDGVGDGWGVAKGVTEGEGVAKGEADGLVEVLPALGVGGTRASAPIWGGVALYVRSQATPMTVAPVAISALFIALEEPHCESDQEAHRVPRWRVRSP